MKNLLIILISIITMSCSTTISSDDVDPQNQAPAGADYSYNKNEGAIIDVKDNPYSVEYTLTFTLKKTIFSR